MDWFHLPPCSDLAGFTMSGLCLLEETKYGWPFIAGVYWGREGGKGPHAG